jgi:hypothetical protein
MEIILKLEKKLDPVEVIPERKYLTFVCKSERL